MNAIVVVDENWGIGKDGGLLVHLPGDLKYFKSKTVGNTVVIGRKTLDSFPGGRPLPDRRNLVLTADENFEREGCDICHSIEDVLKAVKGENSENVFVAGGAQVYEEFFELCDIFYVTKIYDSFEADRFFPNLDEKGFDVTWESEIQEEKGLRYRFLKYVRNNNR